MYNHAIGEQAAHTWHSSHLGDRDRRYCLEDEKRLPQNKIKINQFLLEITRYIYSQPVLPKKAGYRLMALLVAGMMCNSVDAASPVVVDATGRILGFYSGVGVIAPGSAKIITSKGYQVAYSPSSGGFPSGGYDPWGVMGAADATLFFASSDCSGTPYIYASSSGSAGGTSRGGLVRRISRLNGGLYYIPKAHEHIQFESGTTGSTLAGNGDGSVGFSCQATTPYIPGLYLPLLENDPDITGVENEPVTGPLRIEVLDITASNPGIFLDDFEKHSTLVGGNIEKMI